MSWLLPFGLTWAVIGLGVWLLNRAPLAPKIARRCAWCDGWMDAASALLGEIDGVLISHGICDGCAETMEESCTDD